MISAIPFFDEIKGSLELFFSRKDRRDEKLDVAIEALRTATLATLQHLRDMKGADEPSDKLADLWMKAANAIRPFKPELDQYLWAKSMYWVNPQRVSKSDAENMIISLEEIELEIQQLTQPPIV